jgi:uncharacterized protein YdiU (UPF0061 family)
LAGVLVLALCYAPLSMKKLEELKFNNTYAKLGESFYSRVMPTPASDPYLVAFNEDAAMLIDLDFNESKRTEFLELFSGQKLLPGFDPLAMVYAGHQFGVKVPRLGDGRAILLGEVINDREENWDLHLKGSGPTPYSRRGDGYAVLRSSIREYLCGEAMHALGIPSTRTLCIIGSEEPVERETIETRAMIVRMAKSHLRFGSFEFFQGEDKQKLADYVIHHHYPELEKSYEFGPARYGAWLKEVANRTASLIAQWQSVGFAHGVMNTDNMSILGLTLDYGPFGFMEEFDPNYICNHSDDQGRYAFAQQPSVGLWNVNVLAHYLLPLLNQDESYIKEALRSYQEVFHAEQLRLMRAKLGLFLEQESDRSLVGELYQLMIHSRVDHTIFFRSLSLFTNDEKMIRSSFKDESSLKLWDQWSVKYRERIRIEVLDTGEREKRMNEVNPKFILRNYMAQIAIDEAIQKKTYTETARLLRVLRRPFDEHPEDEDYAKESPKWGKDLEISCSS